jgi:hypothetical protein
MRAEPRRDRDATESHVWEGIAFVVVFVATLLLLGGGQQV